MVVSKPKTSDANPARVSYLSIRQSIRQYIQLSSRRYCNIRLVGCSDTWHALLRPYKAAFSLEYLIDIP